MPPTVEDNWRDNEDQEWEEDEFAEGDEDPEADLMHCPSCRQRVHEDTQKCPHCGDWITPTVIPSSSKNLIVLAVVVLLIVALVALTIG